MMDETRTVRGMELFPVDRVAARVTSPGPKWCAPGEKPKAALARIIGPKDARRLRKRIKNPKTARLFDYCDEDQVVMYAKMFLHSPSTLGMRIGFLKLMLGHRLTDHERYNLAKVGIKP